MASSSEADTQNNPLHITCNIWLEETRQVAVSLGRRDHVDDPVQKCIEKAAAAFRFVIEVPDPLQSPADGPSQSRSAASQFTNAVSNLTQRYHYTILSCYDFIFSSCSVAVP